ncbi:tetratricopeptide repeat protein [Geofilum sp. OHC36d9]|uniref:tetratricopeptide repeat protein n=1 Tax=Geofilum sp. OHC36d9 TaxID=3458413 RepID=UPI0040331CF3
MKRLVLLFVSFLAISAVYAQRGKVAAASAFLDNGDLAMAKEKINEALEHPKSKDWAKTYIVAARLATEEYKADKSKSDLILSAVSNYFKAAERDQLGDEKGKGAGRFEKEIKVALTFFMPELQNAGIEAFNAEDYPLALNLFESVIKLNKLPLYEEDKLPADSVFIYYSGLAASRSEKYDIAEKYLSEALDLGYEGGDAVLLLNEIYTATKDTVKMGENLKRGFEKYPQDDRILTMLINFYLQTEQNAEALEYLNKAISTDPENASYYNARGVLYDMSKDYEKALLDYGKALELKDDFFEPLLNIGVIYYNQGAEEMNAANDIQDNKKYEAAKKAANETFRKSLPYMERAHKVKPEDTMVMETLKNLYYRFDMMDQYNEMDSKLKAL